jgi:hypothetical protein
MRTLLRLPLFELCSCSHFLLQPCGHDGFRLTCGCVHISTVATPSWLYTVLARAPLIVCTRCSDVLQWGSSATRFSVCFEPFSRILLCLSCVEFSQAVALVVADLNPDPCAARSNVVGRVLNFLQRDLPLFEEDDEDFELGGGGQTGAGGEAGAVFSSLCVLCFKAC